MAWDSTSKDFRLDSDLRFGTLEQPFIFFLAVTRPGELNLIQFLKHTRHYPCMIFTTICNSVHALNSTDIAMLCSKQTDLYAADEHSLPETWDLTWDSRSKTWDLTWPELKDLWPSFHLLLTVFSHTSLHIGFYLMLIWILGQSVGALTLNVAKTKEMFVDCWRSSLLHPVWLMESQWLQCSSINIWVLSWMINWILMQTQMAYVKRLTSICSLRKLQSFSVEKTLMKMFHSAFIESVLSFNAFCWFGHLHLKNKKKLEKMDRLL